jgi:prevent-host-death family protein
VLSFSTMKQIGIRELRQYASVWIRRVEQGESFQVTDHGRPVALLIPAPTGNSLEALQTSGRLSVPQGDLLELDPPLPARDGEPLPSELLRAARELER